MRWKLATDRQKNRQSIDIKPTFGNKYPRRVSWDGLRLGGRMPGREGKNREKIAASALYLSTGNRKST
jgi:hypothetical protein